MLCKIIDKLTKYINVYVFSIHGTGKTKQFKPKTVRLCELISYHYFLQLLVPLCTYRTIAVMLTCTCDASAACKLVHFLVDVMVKRIIWQNAQQLQFNYNPIPRIYQYIIIIYQYQLQFTIVIDCRLLL